MVIEAKLAAWPMGVNGCGEGTVAVGGGAEGEGFIAAAKKRPVTREAGYSGLRHPGLKRVRFDSGGLPRNKRPT